MIENTNTEGDPKKDQQQDDMSYYEQLSNELSLKNAPLETRRSAEKEISELQELLTVFEKNHSLSNLEAITELSPDLLNLFTNDKDMSLINEETHSTNFLTSEDIGKYLTRTQAKRDLVPITTLLNTLKKETDITDETYNELYAHYRIFSKAVGIVNSGQVEHR